MLIDNFSRDPDAVERHCIEIQARGETVYRVLWETDFGESWALKVLLALRALPEFLIHPRRSRDVDRRLRLEDLIDHQFGRLAEEPGREILLGVTGRFWRPLGNLSPFDEDAFAGRVAAGTARSVWNFAVQQTAPGVTLLATETRVECGDPASRRKFRLYWFFVRPFSGWIRRIMLRAVRRNCRTSLEETRLAAPR